MRVKLKDVVNRINGNIDRFNTDIKYYIGKGHGECGEIGIKQHGDLKKDVETLGFKFRFAFKPGDTLFFSRSFALRKAGMAMFEGLCSDSTYILRTKDEKILLRSYLPAILQNDLFWEYCDTHHTGGVNFLINWSTLADYEFELPSIEEQRVLADKLWAAYHLKESYRRLLTATQEMVKSQFIEMFGDKDFKHTNLEDIVAKDCSLSYGIVQPGEGVDDGVPVVRPVDLTQDVVSPDNLKMTTKEIAQSYKRTTLKGGELLLCVRGTTGVISKASLSLKGANVTRGIVPIWFKNCIDKQFMFYQMKSDAVQKQIKENTYGTTLLQINIKNLRKIDLILPPIELQQQFVAIAEQADKSGFELRKSIEAIDNVIKSLINNQS